MIFIRWPVLKRIWHIFINIQVLKKCQLNENELNTIWSKYLELLLSCYSYLILGFNIPQVVITLIDEKLKTDLSKINYIPEKQRSTIKEVKKKHNDQTVSPRQTPPENNDYYQEVNQYLHSVLENSQNTQYQEQQNQNQQWNPNQQQYSDQQGNSNQQQAVFGERGH